LIAAFRWVSAFAADPPIRTSFATAATPPEKVAPPNDRCADVSVDAYALPAVPIAFAVRSSVVAVSVPASTVVCATVPVP
jgi:hypothetical protein